MRQLAVLTAKLNGLERGSVKRTYRGPVFGSVGACTHMYIRTHVHWGMWAVVPSGSHILAQLSFADGM